MEANVFFTSFGLEAITEERQDKIKVATVGNPRHAPADPIGALPACRGGDENDGAEDGQAGLPAGLGVRRDDRGLGAGIYACKASVDMFGLKRRTSSPRSPA